MNNVLEIDYVLKSRHSEKSIAESEANDYSYSLFEGDLFFRFGEKDFSAEWGWIPLLDFSNFLVLVIRDIKAKRQMTYEFTESDDKIFFKKDAENIVITCNYVDGKALVPFIDLKRTTKDFSRKLLGEIFSLYPSFRNHPDFIRWYSDKELIKAI